MRHIIYSMLTFIFIAGTSFAAEPLAVVASFSILGDMVKQVGGERVKVEMLVGAGGDAHTFSPSAQDAKTLKNAKVIFINGLGFEPWAKKLIKTAGTQAAIIEASKGIAPLEMKEDGRDHKGHNHDSEIDPHAWNDPRNGIKYIQNISDALSAADPEGKAYFEAQAKAYIAQLEKLHADAKTSFAKMPESKRTIALSHDSMGYFAAAYGLKIISAQGFSTEVEPSAKQVGKLISTLKAGNASALFLDSVSNPKILERISVETGIKIGGKLYSDALTAEDGAAPSYIKLLQHNINSLMLVL